ncbi:MAG: ATP-grasp domain-containing protein [Candidatus Saccharibacteria bacterium]|nr:ATP-grasp domain-containing protein [Candidatus Saccharibacteria bacterium]
MKNSDVTIGFMKDGEWVNVADFQTIIVASMFNAPVVHKSHMLGALALFAHAHGIKMMDDVLEFNSGKLYQMMNYALNGILVPDTAYGPLEFLKRVFVNDFGGRAVLKSAFGAKGNDNYLVESVEDLERIVTENPEVAFIMQRFIPNDCDYRVVCLDYKAKMVIRRTRTGETHLNNTSTGGIAEVISLDEINPEILAVAEKTAEVSKVAYAGVDVMEDKETHELYIMEINRTPQIMTGSFVEEKQKMMKDFLLSI